LNCPNCNEEMIEIEENNIYGCISCKMSVLYRPIDNIDREEIQNKLSNIKEELGKYTKSDLSELKSNLNDMVKQVVDFVNYEDDKVH
jgi:hypothetical protein